ncbi:hypothetical protein ATANTOWER_010484 [Ataeniobius toweri]|uniref:Uncharacterized protein n=1 Tax=Ataeniobius toweri TaxID=208326 RepID=A0ABU7CGN3_9TELE|nr:hypothetical protein [Ataeniobius toweri]
MAELNKFTAEHQEEAGSDGEGVGAPEPAAGTKASSELVVQQVRTVDQDGNLKVVYPSKTDLSKEISNLTLICCPIITAGLTNICPHEEPT